MSNYCDAKEYDNVEAAREWIESAVGGSTIKSVVEYTWRHTPTPAIAIMVLTSAMANILRVVQQSNDAETFRAFSKSALMLSIEALATVGVDGDIILEAFDEAFGGDTEDVTLQ